MLTTTSFTTIFVSRNMGSKSSKCNSNDYIAGNKYKANNSGTTSLPGENRAKMVLNPYGYFILYDGVTNPSFTASSLSQTTAFNDLRDTGKAYYLSPPVFRTEKITNPTATRAVIQSDDGNFVVDVEGITNDNKNGNRDRTWALNR